jgi:RNA polymerase sigma factor (sigma-70 family)
LDWDHVFQTHYRSLYRALVGATGRTDGVEDAIQDAFAQGLRGDLPHDVRSVEGWLFVVALNRIKRSRRRATLFVPLRRQEPAADTEDAALTRVDVLARLNGLTQRERELLVAKFYVGLTQDELAKALSIPRGTVSSAISRAAARFRAGGL